MDASVSVVSATERAQRAILFLKVVLAADVLSGLFQAARLLSSPTAEASGVEALINFAQFLGFVLSIVFFLQWMHRAYANLPGLGAERLRFTPGWAVGYFFVPFANLVYPLYAMREIWHHSSPTPPARRSNLEQQSVRQVDSWWIAFFIMNFLSNMSLRLSMKATNHEMEIVSEWFSVASCLFAVPAALMAMSIIRKIDAYQSERIAALPPSPAT